MTKSKKFTSILMGIAMVLMACGVCGVSFSPAVQNYSHAVVEQGDSIGGLDFYKISSETDLQEIAKHIANGDDDGAWAGRNYELIRDLDLSGPNWVPVGTSANPFTGKFNGNGFSIKGNITVDSTVWKPAQGEDASGFVPTAGVFGYTSDAEIYDLVIGDTAGVNPFVGVEANVNNAGRLVGYAKSTTFIDIYDLSFVKNTSSERTLKTIGTADGCTIYDGDTFTYNTLSATLTYKPGTGSEENVVYYDKGSNLHQFDIASEKNKPTVAAGKNNKSILLNKCDKGIVFNYSKATEDAVKTDLLPSRVAVSADGTVRKVYSNKYLSALPVELTTSTANGTPVFLGNAGYKFKGWVDAAGNTYADGNAIASATLSQYALSAKTKKITYNLTIEIPGQDSVSKTVLYNTPWSEIYDFDKNNHQVLPKPAVLDKKGYDLLSVYEDKTTAQDEYIHVVPQYDGDTDGANKNFDVTYPKGDLINAWDDAQETESTIAVTLKTNWQGAPIVSNLVFSNADDTGAKFEGIVGMTLVRNSDNSTITTSQLSEAAANKTYTFRAPADIELTYIVGLSLGYKLTSPTSSVGSVSLVSSSDNLNGDTLEGLQSKYEDLQDAVTFYKYTISGLVPGDSADNTPSVTFKLVREEISINVTAENFSDISVGDQTYTKVEKGSGSVWTLKTRIGEIFNFTATPEDGYEYIGNSHAGFEKFPAPTNGEGEAKVFAVEITSYEKGAKTITLNARAKSFTLELEYVADTITGATLPTFKFNTTYTAQGTQTFEDISIADSYTIDSKGNAYYLDGVVTLATDDNSGAQLEGSNGTYTLTGVRGGVTVKLKVEYKAKTFNATLSGKFADLAKTTAADGITVDSISDILGVDGSPVLDSTVLNFTTVPAFKYNDQITLTASFKDDAASHYDFVGWFLNNGTYISSSMSTTYVAKLTGDVTIYAIVKGKSTTLTVQDGAYVENYNGQVGTWRNMGKTVVTATNKSVTYTFSKPSEGALRFGNVTGYTLKGFLIIKEADLANIGTALTQGNAWKVESTAASLNGYSAFQNAYAGLLAKADSASYIIMPYATQQQMTVHFTNDVSNKEFQEKTYYYDTPLDVTDLKTQFEKPGYTATGWSVYTSAELAGQPTTTLGNDDTLNLNTVNFTNGGNLYLVRNYQINTYNVYFSKELGVPQVQADNTVKTESGNVSVDETSVNGYSYIQVQYGTAFNMNNLPMFNNPGYYLNGFEVVSTNGQGEKWDSETPFKFTQNVIVKPIFAGGKFTVNINENGGAAKAAANKTATLEVDKTLGAISAFASTSDDELAAKLASMFTRAGFKVTGLHFLTKADSTYTVGGKNADGKVKFDDLLTPAFFGTTHFTNTTDKGKTWTTDITLYCRWEFDGTEKVQMDGVSGNFTGSPIEEFNPKITVGSTEPLTWTSNGNTLNSQEVAIDSYEWYYCGTEMSGSTTPFQGTKTAKSPSLIHVSQSGYYKVTYTLVDKKTVTASGFTAAKSKTIEFSAKATINPVAAKFVESALPDEMLADALKDRLLANKAVIMALTDSDNMINSIISASSAKDIATAIGSDADTKAYLVSLILVSDILANKNIATLYKALLAGTDNETIVDTIASKTLTKHRTWLKSVTTFKTYASQIEAFNTALTPCLYAKTYDGESTYLTKYASQVFALNFEGGSTITSGVTATIVDEAGTAHSDVNVLDFTKEELEQGKALKLVITLASGFEATDFTNIKSEGGTLVFEQASVPNGVYGLIVPGITSFNLTLTKGVENESHTQELTSTYDYTSEFVKIVATVEPESEEAGVYSFFGGEGHRLLIKSYKLYTATDKYYTVTINGDDVTIDNNGNSLELNKDKLKNLSLYVDGEYEIVSATSMPKTEISAQTLTANSDNTKLDIALKGVDVKLKSVTFNNGAEAKTVTVSGNYVMDTVSGVQKLIAQISGNDSQTVIVYVSEYVTKLTFEIANDENAVFIGMHETKTEDGYYENMLKTASALNSTSAEYAVTKGNLPATIGAIFTKATRVTHAWTSDGTKKVNGTFGDEFDRYVNFDGTYNVPLEAMYEKEFAGKTATTRAYVYSNWTADSFAAAGEEITNNSKSLTATIRATKSLATPTLNKETLTITDYATAFYASAEYLLTEANASVQNKDESLIYTYTIYKESDSQDHIAWTTKSSGEYRIEISVADKNGNYESRTSAGDKYILTLTLNKTPLELELGTTYTFNYNKTDHKSAIQATLSSEAFDDVTRALFAEGESGFGSLFDFEIKKDGTGSATIQDAGTYSITATLKAGAMTGGYGEENFEDVFEFASKTFENIVVNKAKIELTDQVLQQNSVNFTKAVGENDPALTFTFTTEYSEQVQITLVRDKSGDSEKAGTYAYTSASVDNENYEIDFKVESEKFTITEAEYGITATLSAAKEFVYDGEHTYTATLEYNEGSNQWEIKLNKDGALAHTFTLTDLKFTGVSGKAPKVDKNTLNGATLTIGNAGKIKDVGDYKFTVGGDLTEYTGALTLEGNPVAVKVTPKALTLSKVSREFDNTDTFEYRTNGEGNAETLKATVEGLVSGENVTLTGKFSAKIGSDLSISELAVDDDNYTVSLSDTATIEKSSKKITMDVATLSADSKLTFTYGEVKQGLEAILSKITLKNGDLTTFAGAELSTFITKSVAVTDEAYVGDHNYLKANPAGYSATITLSSDCFAELESKTITVVVNKKAIEITDEIIRAARGNFSKNVGDAFKDPTFSYTTELQESVTITLVVDITADKHNTVGTYSYKSATVNNENYSVTLAEDLKSVFTINKSQYGIKATLEYGESAQPHTFNYKGSTTITPSLEFEGGKWVIKLTEGEEVVATYTLTLTLSNDGELVAADNTLEGLSVSISGQGGVANTIKDAGSYNFTFGGKLAQYTGTFELVDSPIAVQVNQRKLTLSNVSREYDTTDVFSYTTGGNNGTTATVETVVEGETVTLTGKFSAAIGEGLTISNLAVDETNSKNYTVELSDTATIVPSKAKFTITIDEIAEGKLTFTYGQVDKTLSEVLGKIKLTIDGSDKFHGVALNTLIKPTITFTNGDSDIYVGTYNYLKASSAEGYAVKVAIANVGSKVFEATETQEITIVVNKKAIEITDEIIEAAEGNFSKNVGDEFSNPTFSYTVPTTQEAVQITLQVNFAGGSNDTVGLYPYSGATVSDTDNYTVSLKADLTSKYEIKEAENGITATIDGIHSFAYEGEHTYTAELEYNSFSSQWEIKLYKDGAEEVAHVYKLTLSLTGAVKELKVDANTLKGATLTIGSDGKVKDVGDYKFVVGGNLSQYTGELTFTSNVAIHVNKKELTLSDVTREYDTTTEFNYNTQTGSASGTTATVAGVVEGEHVTITGTFSANIGSNLTISGLQVTNSGNYTVTHSDKATITPSTVEFKITIDGIESNERLTFTYGDVKQDLQAILDKITLTIGDSDANFHGVALNTLVKPKITFTKGTEGIFVGNYNYLKATTEMDGYEVTISIENIGAQVFVADESQDINILVKQKVIEITDDIISKSNGTFFKYVGEEFKNPTFTYTDDKTQESVTITLVVNITEDKKDEVGTYPYKEAKVDNDNYSVTLAQELDSNYEIKQATDGIRATLTYEGGKPYEFDYKGEVTIVPELKFESGVWKIKLHKDGTLEGEVVATYTLELKLTSHIDSELHVQENTLEGISIAIKDVTANKIKNAGDYYFAISGKLTNYAGNFELDDNPVAVHVNKRTLTFTRVEKEFDNTTTFTYVSGTVNTGLTVEGALDVVDGEQITIKGTFGGTFGEVGLTGLIVDGNSNYYIAPTFEAAKIIRSTKTVTIEVKGEESLSFEYGALDKSLEELRKLITLKIDDEPTFGEAQVSSFITEIQLTGPRDDDYTQIGKLKVKEGAYEFTITLVTDKFTVTPKQINVTVTKKKIKLTDDDIQDYFKYVGESDPSLKFDKLTDVGEQVTIKLTRDAGEAVNTYEYTDVQVYDYNTDTLSTNYSVTKTAVTKTFEVRKAQDGIVATLNDSFDFTYGEHKDVTAELKFEGSEWKIDLKAGGETIHTYTLTLNYAGASGRAITPDSMSLNNISISINGTATNAGTYDFTIAGELTQYTGKFTFVAGTHALVINKKQITVSDVSREFDNTDEFKFTYTQSENNSEFQGTKATVADVVAGDTVVLTGTFKKSGASAIIGSELTIEDLKDTNSENYTVVFSGTAEIKKSTQSITIDVADLSEGNKLTFTYGGVKKGLQEVLDKITLKIGEFTSFKGYELSNITKNIAFDSDDDEYVDKLDFLKANEAGYSITISLNSEYFDVEATNKQITLVVNKKEIEVNDDLVPEFSKYVGGVEPALTFEYTVPGLNEQVTIKLTREEGENYKEGGYNYTEALICNLNTAEANANYKANLTATETFMINLIESKLIATIKGTPETFPYDGTQTIQVKLKYVKEAQKFVIELYKGAVQDKAFATYDLELKLADSSKPGQALNIFEHTLDGLTISISESEVGKAQKYHFTFSGDLTNFEGDDGDFAFSEDSPVAFEITKRVLTFNGAVTKQFDNTTDFTYHVNGSNDESLIVTVDNVYNNEKFDIAGTFNGVFGKVGLKDLTVSDDNYTINATYDDATIIKSEKKVTIEVAGYTEKYTFTYGDIDDTYAELIKKITLKVDNSDTINDTAIYDNFVKIVFECSGSDNFTSIHKLKASESDYTITIKLTSQYFNASATKEITVHINKLAQTVEDKDIVEVKDNKFVGENDPSFTFTYHTDLGEDIQVALVRAQGVDQEKAGTYSFTGVTTEDTNYDVKLGDITKQFTINKANDGITATIEDELYSFIYGDNGSENITPSLAFEGGKWVIKLTKGETVVETYTLKLTLTGSESELEVNANTLEGITEIKLDKETVKDAGEYRFVVTGNLKNYNGEFKFANDLALTVKQRALTIQNVTKEFDNKTDFKWIVNGETNPTTTKATVTNDVYNDKITITGQFAEKSVGSHQLTLEVDNKNYTIDEQIEAQIIKSTQKVEVEIKGLAVEDKLTLTYGSVSGNLEEIKSLITLKVNGSDQIEDEQISGFVEMSLTGIDEGQDLSTAGKVKVNAEGYTITINLTSESFTAENKVITLIIAKKEVKITPDSGITKVFDNENKTAQEFTIEGIEPKDLVTIESALYASVEPSDSIAIQFTIKGNDKDNYNITNLETITGAITEKSIEIKFVVDPSTEGEGAKVSVDGVRGTTFVDSQHVADKDAVNISLPYSDKQTEYGKLGEPEAKKGYKFAGWYYEKSDEYTLVDQDNLQTYLLENVGKTSITLYASYTIETYKVEVALGEGGARYEVTEEGKVEGSVDTYTYKYYSDITITGHAKSGYREANSPQRITHIDADHIGEGKITLNFYAVSVQFTIKISRSDIYQRQGHTNTIKFTKKGAYEWRSGIDGQATLTVAYNALSGVTLADLLPTIEIEGYTLTAGGTWKNGESSFVANSTANVQTSLVDVINGNFHEQISIELTLDKDSLVGNSHTITLNAGEGHFDSKEMTTKEVEINYGDETKVSEFAKPTRVGYEFKGWTYQSEEFNDVTDPRYGYDSDITLEAEWEVQSYTLTLNLTKATVIVAEEGGQNLSPTGEPNQYKLVYNKKYNITVTAAAGYEITDGSWNPNESELYTAIAIGGDYSKIQISELSQDATLTITAFAKENHLTITKNDDFTSDLVVSCDGKNIDLTEGYYKVYTDKVIKITLTPIAGHSVKGATVQDGKGKIEFKDDAWELTGFTSDITVVFDIQPDDVTATINIDEGVEVITISENGRVNDHNNAKYTITTTVDKALKLNVKLKAGYKFKSINGMGYTENHEENLDEDSDVYTIVVTLSKFTAGFEVTIETEKRAYTMTAKVVVIDRDNQKIDGTGFTATVNNGETAQVTFTETAQFKTETTQAGYIFVGWFEGDLSDGVDGYDLASGVKLRDYDYVVNNPKDATFTAVWRLGLFIVTAKVGDGKGTITVDGEVVAQNGGKEYRTEVIIGHSVTLVANAAEGYAIDGWTLDGHAYAQTTQNGSTVELTVGETDYNFVVNFKPLPVEVNVQSKVSINKEFKDAENTEEAKHGLIKWAYTAEELEVGGGNTNLSAISSETDKDVYFKVTTKEGYEFDNFYVLDGDASAPIDPVEGKENIYKLTGLIGEEETSTYNFYARFVATVGNFTIKFIDEMNQHVDAGRISVVATNLLNIQSNNNSTVHVSAVTGSGFEVTVNINIGYKFADTPVLLKGNYAKVNPSEVKPDENILSTGHSYTLTFLVVDVVGGDDSNSEIEIHVIPETYKVRLNAKDVWESPKDFTVTLGGYIDNLTPETAIPVKDGYEFVGYYTYANGGGIKYIDKTGAQIRPWNESGYVYNGETYSLSPNFQNGYINLYADFIIKKTEINVQVVPDALKGVEPYNLKVKNLIQNFNDNATWTKDGEEFDYIAEVLFKTAVTIEAYNSYNGYKFDRWQITGYRQGETELSSPYAEDDPKLKQIRIENLEHDGYVTLYVKALYLANITLDVNDVEGGDVWFTVEGDEEGEYTDEWLQGKKITLHAQAKPGYRFVKWVNTKTSDEFFEETIELTGELVPSDFVAYFEGLTISVEVVLPTEHGQIEKVTLYHADEEVGEFTKNETKFVREAQVGDEVKMVITRDKYFEVKWNVSNVDHVEDETTTDGNIKGYYSYKVEHNNGETIVLTPTIVQITCKAELRVTLQGVNSESELNLAGVVRYRKPNETEWNIFTGTSEPFDTYAGGKLLLDIRPAPNYKIARVTIQVPNVITTYRDVTATYAENGIDLFGPDGAMYESFVITVVLARDMWIDTVDIEHTLSGNGTSSNPYMINSREDLIYMAHKINVERDTAFTNASYKLGADIDLTGKFWSPIGTERNKFNGKFDFGTHKVTGITLNPTDIELEHHYNGLFGFMTGSAKIVEQNQELMIALITVGAILLAIAIALLIFFLVRRQRKKKMEELQNS